MRDAEAWPQAGAADVVRERPAETPDVTRDVRTFTMAIRTRSFTFLRAWSIGRDAAALQALDTIEDDSGGTWTVERLADARARFGEEHGTLRLDPEGRNRRHTYVEPSRDGATWRVQQMLVDSEGLNDWVAELEVDLAASRKTAEPVIQLLRLDSLVP